MVLDFPRRLRGRSILVMTPFAVESPQRDSGQWQRPTEPYRFTTWLHTHPQAPSKVATLFPAHLLPITPAASVQQRRYVLSATDSWLRAQLSAPFGSSGGGRCDVYSDSESASVKRLASVDYVAQQPPQQTTKRQQEPYYDYQYYVLLFIIHLSHARRSIALSSLLIPIMSNSVSSSARQCPCNTPYPYPADNLRQVFSRLDSTNFRISQMRSPAPDIEHQTAVIAILTLI